MRASEPVNRPEGSVAVMSVERAATDELVLVYATWCPHCEPLSTERAPRLAARLGARLTLLDIDDRAQEARADEIVRQHGDWDPDYLIPQLFLRHADGTVEHLLTGIPGSVAATRSEWDRVFQRFGSASAR